MPADAGSAWLDILPRLVDFGSKLQSQVNAEMSRAGSAGGRAFEGELGKIKAQIPISTDKAKLDAELRETGARVKAGTEAARSDVPVGAQTVELDTKLAELPAKTQAAAQQAASTVPINAETSGFEGAMQRIGSLAQEKFTAVAGQSTIASKALGLLSTVGVNVSQALTQTGQSAQQSAEGMNSSADAAATVGTAMYSANQTGIQAMSTGLKVGIAAGAIVAVGALKLAEQGVRDFVSQTADVRKIKAATGEAAEGASELRNQIVGLGIDTDVALKTLGIFSRTLVENASRFADYGIAIERTNQGTIDVAATLRNVALAYQETNGPAERNAMLTELLGRNSAALRPLLSANRAELERLAKTGPIYSERDLETGKEFSRQSREMRLAVERLGVSLGRTLVPASIEVFGWLTKLADAAEWANEKLKDVGVGGFFANRQLSNLPGTQKKVADTAEDQADAERESADAMELAADEAQDLADRLDDLAQAQRDAMGAQMSVTEAHHRAWENAMDLREAEEELTEAYKEHGQGSREAERAEARLESARQSSQQGVIALAQAVADQQLAVRRTAGEEITAVKENEAYRQQLLIFAGTVKDPMRAEILLLAGNIREIPDSHNTVITADTSAAQARIRALKVEIANLGVGGGRGAEMAAAENNVEANYGMTPATVGGESSLDFGDGIPGAAEGAYVKHTPGGTLMRVGEGRNDEVIAPLPDLAPRWSPEDMQRAVAAGVREGMRGLEVLATMETGQAARALDDRRRSYRRVGA